MTWISVCTCKLIYAKHHNCLISSSSLSTSSSSSFIESFTVTTFNLAIHALPYPHNEDLHKIGPTLWGAIDLSIDLFGTSNSMTIVLKFIKFTYIPLKLIVVGTFSKWSFQSMHWVNVLFYDITLQFLILMAKS